MTFDKTFSLIIHYDNYCEKMDQEIREFLKVFYYCQFITYNFYDYHLKEQCRNNNNNHCYYQNDHFYLNNYV